jgi:spermidine synthase
LLQQKELYKTTIDYFSGGFIAEKSKNNLWLFYIVLFAAAFTALMPLSSKLILMLSANLSLLPAIIISTILFLMPPVFLMGMVSPLIIEKLSNENQQAGKISGSIYAISTLGGIIATFAMGFYIIPHIGLSKPAYFTGICLAILPLWAIFNHKKKVLSVLIFFLFIGITVLKKSTETSDIKILYQEEGLLGQIMVVDYPVYESQKTPNYYIRMMMFNRVIQAFYNKNDSAHTYFPYVNVMVNECKNQLKGGNALLLGLGGGCVANELLKNNFNIDAVELDKRVSDAALAYFNLDPKIKVYIDDARRYINNTNKKYDLIIFDVFKGEENPAHVITLESLNKLNEKLNPNGLIVINGYGFRTGAKSRGIKAIINTLQHAGYHTEVVPSTKKEEEGNLLVFAKQNVFLSYHKTYQFNPSEIKNSPLLIDDQPILDILNREAVVAWRSAYIATAIKDFNQRNVPLFN